MRVGIGGGDLQMLGRQAVDQGGGGVELRHDDHRAVVVPTRARDLLARQKRQRAFDGGFDLRGERRVVGDEDALRRGVVLGLAKQIGGDPVGVVRAVGDDQYLGRAGDGIDADLAEDFALGGSDIGVARTDDLVDG
ncbi:MAG: hypothetical protein WDM81_14245 [Rhizomicrobium sp.]